MKFQDLLDHFDDRPEIRERIRKNTAKDWPENKGIYPDSGDESLAQILARAFSWRNDGDFDFWGAICFELKKLKTNDQ